MRARPSAVSLLVGLAVAGTVPRQALALVKHFDVSLGGDGDALTRSGIITPLVAHFGFNARGRVYIQLDSETAPPSAGASFAMWSRSAYDGWYDDALRSGTLDKICTLPATMRIELPRRADGNNLTASFTVPRVDDYFLALIYCRRAPARVVGQIILTNPPGDNHLSLEFIGLQPLLVVFIFAYVIIFGLWIALCWHAQQSVKPIQSMFGLAIFTKLLEMALLLAHTWSVNQTGLDVVSLRIAKDIGASLSAAVLLLVLLLTALGWTLTRPHLTLTENRGLFVLFSLYLLIGVFKAICRDEDRHCNSYLLAEYLLKSLIMLSIIVATNLLLTHLKTTIKESTWTLSTPASYAKILLYHSFRWSFLALLLLPTVLLILKITLLSWRYDWANTGIGELITFSVYCHIGFIFRPVSRTSYDSISDAITDGKSLDDEAQEGAAPVGRAALSAGADEGVLTRASGNGGIGSAGTENDAMSAAAGLRQRRGGVERTARFHVKHRSASSLGTETRSIIELIRAAATKHAPMIRELCQPAELLASRRDDDNN